MARCFKRPPWARNTFSASSSRNQTMPFSTPAWATCSETAAMDAKAAEWYEKALRLDSNDLEARHSLFIFATTNRNIDDAKVHAMALVRSFLDGHTDQNRRAYRRSRRFVGRKFAWQRPPSFRERLLGTQSGKGRLKRRDFYALSPCRGRRRGDDCERCGGAGFSQEVLSHPTRTTHPIYPMRAPLCCSILCRRFKLWSQPMS